MNCIVCGLPVYALSMGGPSICPDCDCDGTGVGRLTRLLAEKDAEIERLKKYKIEHEGWESERITQLEKELERLAEVVAAKHPIGKVKAIGLLEAVEGAVQVIDNLEHELDLMDAKVAERLQSEILKLQGGVK